MVYRVHHRNHRNHKQDIGIALLGITSAFGIWSAMNTSPVGMVKFAVDRPDVTYRGMNIGLLLILALSAGIGLYYKRQGAAAAITTAATGAGLWLWYDHLIKTEAK
jgi:hypothetical protein